MSLAISLFSITLRLVRNFAQRLASRLWYDERGVIQASQAILLLVLLGLGMVAGLTALRDQIVQEYGDASLALENINQSYFYENVVSTPQGDIVVSSTSYVDTVGSLADLEDFVNETTVPGTSPENGQVDSNLLDGHGDSPAQISFPSGTPEGISLVLPPAGPNEIEANGEGGGVPSPPGGANDVPAGNENGGLP